MHPDTCLEEIWMRKTALSFAVHRAISCGLSFTLSSQSVNLHPARWPILLKVGGAASCCHHFVGSGPSSCCAVCKREAAQ